MRILSSNLWLVAALLVSPGCVVSHPFHGLEARQTDGDAVPTITSATSPRTRSSDSTPEKTMTGNPTSQTKDLATPTTTKKINAVDPRKPPGAVIITNPVTTSGSQYYKIGQHVTFGWNYTNLIINPTAINVEAFCSKNGVTYTITNNMTFATPSIVWDTNSYQGQNDQAQPPLAVETYTLHIYDAAKAYTAQPSAGQLAAFNGFKFGMYTPQPYTPLADYKCASCERESAASGPLDVVALRMMLLVSVISSLSFIWFVSGVC